LQKKKKRKEIKGRMAFDTSILLEQLLSSKRGIIIKDYVVRGEIIPYITEVTLTETLYVLCRHIGWNRAKERVKLLVDSGFFIVEDLEHIREHAAQYKCKRRISLADCFTLGLAKYISAPALFAFKEKEIVEENSKEPFDVEIIFLDDIYENF